MEQSSQPVAINGFKLVGERLLPGASLMMEGQIVAGAAHTIVSTLARVALGPAGVALVAANSFATSTTGKNLLKQFSKGEAPAEEEEAPAEDAPDAEAPAEG